MTNYVMQIKDITNHLEQLAPLEYAQDFDNVGLLVGNDQEEVTGVLVTLDCLETVVEEAIEKNCNLIVTFHPIIFSGLKHLRETDYVRRTVVKAIKNNIAIYATHTALDMAHGGVSHKIASQLNLTDVKTLIPEKNILKKLSIHVPPENISTVRNAVFKAGAGDISEYSQCSFTITGSGTFKPGQNTKPYAGNIGERSTVEEMNLEVVFLPHRKTQILKAMHKAHPYEEISYQITALENEYSQIGMGAIGELPATLSHDDFLTTIKSVFQSGAVRSSLSRKQNIKKVAVLGGSGAFAIKNALQAGADAYITADLKYHDFFQGENILLCDVGHYESEQFTKNLIQEYLTEKFSNFAILCAQARTNPVNYT